MCCGKRCAQRACSDDLLIETCSEKVAERTCSVATRRHGHGHVSTHVRWLYNLTRVSKAAALFDAFVLGPHQQEPFRQSQRGLVVSWLLALGDLRLSQRTTSERTVKQACLSSCCIARGRPSSKVFSDRFPERIVLEV